MTANSNEIICLLSSAPFHDNTAELILMQFNKDLACIVRMNMDYYLPWKNWENAALAAGRTYLMKFSAAGNVPTVPSFVWA